MADEKPTTHDNRRPLELPSVTIPDNPLHDRWGWPTFTIHTQEGDIAVDCGCQTAHCTGSVAALVSAGFMLKEWVPGLPGNNKTRQTVAFDAEGTRLITGGRKGVQTKAPHITVVRRSAKKMTVEVPLSPEDRDRVYTMVEKHRAVERSASAGTNEAFSPSTARSLACQNVETAVSWLIEQVGKTGCTYTPDSLNRIHQSFEGLRRAFADGNLVPVQASPPKYQALGNVICWPGRGNVAPVAPALLQ